MFKLFKYLIVVFLLQSSVFCFGKDFRESISLNGQWDFKLIEPKQSKQWSKINVPGHWELHGFSRPQWAWPKKEAGLYKKEVVIPENWNGKRVYVNFGAVYYRAKVYFDGKFLGEHENGYNEFEYEITDIVKPGSKGELKLEVYTYGKYLDFDNLDFWALGGIFRDVNLIARPMVHIDNWNYSTKWSETKAGVTLSGQLNKNIDGQMIAEFSFDGKKVVESKLVVNKGSFDGVVEVLAPKGWTAETPNLYDLKLKLKQGGDIIDLVEERVGLREIKVAGPDLLVNGKAIKILGVARHDSWADTGRVVSEKISRLDIELMKKTGINAVRTAHHTPEKSFLKLADEIGLYVFDNIAMSNVEHYLDNPDYLDGIILRTQQTIARDILHPCVITWVMGNENGMSDSHTKMYEEITKMDKSRPSLMPSYAGNDYFPELNSIHYPRPYHLMQSLSDFPNRPMICTEYQHSAFDGIGGLEETWDVFNISPAGCGGTIWEWFDQGLKHDWHLTWQNYWPEIFSVWPEVVAMSPEKDTTEMPCGFGPGKSCAPITVLIDFKGDAGCYKLNIYILDDQGGDRVEVSCDGKFAGVYKTKKGKTDVSYPVKLQYDGKHNVAMRWDYSGGGHDFDCIELVDEKGKLVWQIGQKDNSSKEFAIAPKGDKMDHCRVDTVNNEGTDGMLGPYREKQDEYYNIRAVYAPVQIKQKSVNWINQTWTVDVENRYSFTDLNDKTQFVLQYYDGKNVKEKIVKGPKLKLKALAKKRIDLDLKFIKNQKNLAAISWQIPGKGKYSPDMLGQIWLNASDVPPTKKMPESDIQINAKDDKIIVKAGKANIVFDKKAGALSSYSVDGKTLIQDIIQVGMWKPMLVHEQQFLYLGAVNKKWTSAAEFLKHQPDGDFVRKPRTMQYEKVDDKLIVTFINQYLLSGTEKELMRGFESYEIDSKGHIMLKGCWWWQAGDSQLRRLGFNFVFPSHLKRLTYSGEGPWACYSDAKAGTDDCIHQLDRSDRRISTNKTDIKWLKWSDGDSGLILNPDWLGDIEASVADGVTIQRISRTRGCGNKYMLPSPKDMVWLFHNQLIQMAVEIYGY